MPLFLPVSTMKARFYNCGPVFFSPSLEWVLMEINGTYSACKMCDWEQIGRTKLEQQYLNGKRHRERGLPSSVGGGREQPSARPARRLESMGSTTSHAWSLLCPQWLQQVSLCWGLGGWFLGFSRSHARKQSCSQVLFSPPKGAGEARQLQTIMQPSIFLSKGMSSPVILLNWTLLLPNTYHKLSLKFSLES